MADNERVFSIPTETSLYGLCALPDYFIRCRLQFLNMTTEQYHEPPEELSAETRTFARMITSLIEEADAINWYEQRMSVESDTVAKAILQNAQNEEFKHFGMDLEFLLRRMPVWRETLKGILFTSGDIVKAGEKAEEKADD